MFSFASVDLTQPAFFPCLIITNRQIITIESQSEASRLAVDNSIIMSYDYVGVHPYPVANF